LLPLIGSTTQEVTMIRLKTIACCATAAGLLASSMVMTVAQTKPPTPAELVQAMRSGGHVIFIRHTATEKDYADQVKAVTGDCSTQRMLSEAGWQDARRIGAAFTRLAIPVAEVVSSEYCRAWQTADLAFGRYTKNPALNFEKAKQYTSAQTAAMKNRVAPLLARTPPAGNNLVLVGHDDPFEAATGIYPEPMGVTFVLRPDGRGGFTVVGSIKPTEWPDAVAPN
jgi:phosphohistidine phosphatase SixA